jgi:hypothetical protein
MTELDEGATTTSLSPRRRSLNTLPVAARAIVVAACAAGTIALGLALINVVDSPRLAGHDLALLHTAGLLLTAS